ncbi:MAG TPA: hypothetical protein PLP42_11580, partial [Acidobacteriota bacterium]|nr:hypothetical protein [Acidobacteriota bacterium]
MHQQIHVKTNHRIELQEITRQVNQALGAASVREGI